jgi:hypothetical protein
LHTAKWVRHGKVVAKEQLSGRATAMHQAISRFPDFVSKFGVTAVEVWEDQGGRHLRHEDR